MSRRARRYPSGDTQGDSQGCPLATPAVTLPPRRDGLHVRWRVGMCPCRRLAMGRPVHGACLRTA